MTSLEKACVNMSAINDFSDGDKEMAQIMISTFIRQSNKNISVLTSNVVDGECQDWTEAAHSLKGSSANFGAEQLSYLCMMAQNMSIASAGERKTLLQKIEDEYLHIKNFIKGEGYDIS